MKLAELYYPSLKWYELEINNTTIMDEPTRSNKKGLEQLYLEAEEYDFLMGKTPKVLPDYWEDED